MESNKKYWKGLDELNKTPEFVEANQGEFAERLPIEEVMNEAGLSTKAPRRDFLKALGFGLGAVTLAACQRSSVEKSIPYLVKPEEVTPGVPNFYASSYRGQSIIVKTREGRPIKIEGNPSAILGNHGTDAVTQASVLDLYDVSKLKGPKVQGKTVVWKEADSFVAAELEKVRASGKKIRIISSTVNSPSTKAVVSAFTAQFPNTQHINVDAVSYTGIIKANENSFGKGVIPRYRFDKADVIVSFGADFLGTWIAGEEFTKQWVGNRNAGALKNKKMSRHIQFETGLSMTGTNADSRIPVKPSEQGIAILALYSAITGTTIAGTGKVATNPIADKAIKLAAKELLAAKGKALVVSGSNDVATQTVVNAINSALGAYGTTIDLDNPFYQFTGNDAQFAEFINEMNRGEVGAVFFLNANPAYTYFNSKAFTDALAKVGLRVSFADREDETAALCNVITPNHNYLESWGDESAFEGYYTIVQPTINPVHNTRQAEESLLIWAKSPQTDYYQFVRDNWEKNLLAGSGKTWKEVLQSGYAYKGEKPVGTYSFGLALDTVGQTIVSRSKSLASELELSLYETGQMRDGRYANNAYLQELPDAVSKVTWDNYAAMNPKTAEKLGLAEFDLATIKGSNGYSVVLPVLYQPGQAQGTVSIAVGYGRTKAGKAGNEVGKNAYPFAAFVNGTVQFTSAITVEKAGGAYELAQTQTHHSFEGRNVIREASFKEYSKDPFTGTGHGAEHKTYDLWNTYELPGHNWVMAIDLNACTGCGACVVACNVENNIPVVGRDEIRRRRDMHWIRIDRYYSFNQEDGTSVTEEKEIEELENFDNISVVHQPMLCQHCDHAPCETVCPVIATMHSSDGLNHMAYNRCIGTRYCANNCPYKVRRFNWFNYWNDARFDNYLNNEFTQLVLNPDVTARSRGVMEKCSFCIQRIQAGKLQAKLERRPLKDGDVQVACAQACSAGAIIFGDGNDPNSAVSKALKDERTYYVLQEINTQPSIGYQVKVRNSVEA